MSQNRETVGRAGLDVVHEVYDPDHPVHRRRSSSAISSVASTYCSLCADDDVLFTDQLSGLFDVLDADPALAVAHGYYVNVRLGADFDLWHTDYSAPSIVADDALGRIVQQMSDYQAIFYGVHRTHVMKSIRLPLDRVEFALGEGAADVLAGPDRRRRAPRAAILHGAEHQSRRSPPRDGTRTSFLP